MSDVEWVKPECNRVDLNGTNGVIATLLSVAGVATRRGAQIIDESILESMSACVDGAQLLTELAETAAMLRSSAKNLDAVIELLGLEHDPGPGMDA
jgi:hypothetical protein